MKPTNNIPEKPNYKSRLELITPEKASKLLAMVDVKLQRKPSMHAVNRYAREMSMGRWQGGTRMIVSKSGKFIDGQQRALAVVKSGVPIWCEVAYDFDDDFFIPLDGGKRRNASDQLQGLGYTSTHRKVSVMRMIAACIGYKKPWLEVADFILIYDAFGDSIEYAMSKSFGDKGYTTAPVMGAVAFAHSVFPKETEKFYDQYVNGENIHRGMPSYTLRKYIANAKQKGGGTSVQSMMRNAALSALRAHIKRDEIKQLNANDNGARAFFWSSQSDKCIRLLKALGEDALTEMK